MRMIRANVDDVEDEEKLQRITNGLIGLGRSSCRIFNFFLPPMSGIIDSYHQRRHPGSSRVLRSILDHPKYFILDDFNPAAMA